MLLLNIFVLRARFARSRYRSRFNIILNISNFDSFFATTKTPLTMSSSAQPTSRKKYYLSVLIKTDLITCSFIPELSEYISSTTNVTIRDIFMPNSNRMGCFSVKTKKIADKLITSIENNNLSCRGRKPSAKIIQINHSHFQIKLSNLNNVITKKEFIEWVMSLNYDSFDIQIDTVKTKVLPSTTSNNDDSKTDDSNDKDNIDKDKHKTNDNNDKETECIVAFDQIDNAITVRDKLNNVSFKGHPLYFTHWHVPRRTSYPDINKHDFKNRDQSILEISNITTKNINMHSHNIHSNKSTPIPSTLTPNKSGLRSTQSSPGCGRASQSYLSKHSMIKSVQMGYFPDVAPHKHGGIVLGLIDNHASSGYSTAPSTAHNSPATNGPLWTRYKHIPKPPTRDPPKPPITVANTPKPTLSIIAKPTAAVTSSNPVTPRKKIKVPRIICVPSIQTQAQVMSAPRQTSNTTTTPLQAEEGEPIPTQTPISMSQSQSHPLMTPINSQSHPLMTQIIPISEFQIVLIFFR